MNPVMSRFRGSRGLTTAIAALAIISAAAPMRAQEISLQVLVTPSTVIVREGKPLTFAIHGFIEFKSLGEVFPYIEAQKRRWEGKITEKEKQQLSRELLREGIESRAVSMADERPLQALVTHTSGDLREAIERVKEPLPPGYAEAFLAVQEKWKHSVNCWSASPVIAGRVLSNWYPIEEGIRLHGAVYDSTEHFWQAVKYHPETTIGELKELIGLLESKDWNAWLRRLDDDPKIYLANAYAVEFLRYNLRPERLKWFGEELGKHGLKDVDHARLVQQRGENALRFSALEEKILWGDLADFLHMVYLFSPANDPVRKALAGHHFDGVYLDNKKLGFISEEFRAEMLEIWKVKFLEMPRFREVIAGIPLETRLEHFLNDGDSPDIPLSIYVPYLNRIRDLARGTKGN